MSDDLERIHDLLIPDPWKTERPLVTSPPVIEGEVVDGLGRYVTKDSGERAHFASGMQRDTEEGKPRFDLMVPLDVPYEEQFLTRIAALMGRGADKYNDRNWEKADSDEELRRMKSSAFRHFFQWLCGESDEDHAAAVVFNLIAHESTKHKIESGSRLA